MPEAGSAEPYIPTDEARKLHAISTAQAWADERASTDAFDNNLLTFSSGALGLSVAFIKDIVPLESAEWLTTLYISWIAFGGCILVTIMSFQISALAQRAHTGFVDDYYLRGNKDALNQKSVWSRLIPVCSALGSLLLFAGIVLTIVFAANDITHYKETKAWQVITKTKR